MSTPSWLPLAQSVYWAVTLLVAGSAMWTGDRGQRVGAGVLVGNFALSSLLQGLYWRGLQVGAFAADLLMLGVFIALALAIRRWWLRAAGGFALLSCLTHPAVTFSPDIWMTAYVAIQWVIGLMLVGAVAAGVIEAPFARGYERWAGEHRAPSS